MTAPTSMGARVAELSPQGLLLAFSAVLAFTAGFVNAVALFILAFPVGNLTGVTTQLGMDTANPVLYESELLAGILVGFMAGAVIAGAILAPTHTLFSNRHAVVLAIEALLLLLACAGVETEITDHLVALGTDQPVVEALFAAAALGMQNGLTSSFRGMAIRTTHFTGTITDLGLMLGRSRRHGIDRWKAAILAATLLLFLAGGVAGLIVGAEMKGKALIVPAGLCLIVAAFSVLHSHHTHHLERARAATETPDSVPSPAPEPAPTVPSVPAAPAGADGGVAEVAGAPLVSPALKAGS